MEVKDECAEVEDFRHAEGVKWSKLRLKSTYTPFREFSEATVILYPKGPGRCTWPLFDVQC